MQHATKTPMNKTLCLCKRTNNLDEFFRSPCQRVGSMSNPMAEVSSCHVSILTILSDTSLVNKAVNSRDSRIHQFEGWISSAVDVYKGIFIIFMLTEHTRSAFAMDMTPDLPIMQFVSQVACALDMTCFSTAYGFSCYRAYLTNSKGRTLAAQVKRLLRSVGLIVVAAWFCNISFELVVLRNPPTWSILGKIFTFEVVYWDFLTTFPCMLLVGFVTTKPLLAIASANKSILLKFSIFAILLGLPLLAPYLSMETCPTYWSKYWALFAGCVRRSMGTMRFSAFTYMFYFNFGCIVSMLTLEFSREGAIFKTLRETVVQPHWVAFSVLFAVELYFAIPVIQNYNTSWEYFDWNGYRRFPMTAPLILAWGFLSQCVGITALFLTAFVQPHIWSAATIPWLRPVCRVLEHFGANVLLYLTVSNFVIHGLFQIDWEQFQGSSRSSKKPQHVMSLQAWEWIVVGAAIGQILFVQLLSYMVKSSRK